MIIRCGIFTHCVAILAQIPSEQDLMGTESIEFSGSLHGRMRASMRLPKRAIRNQMRTMGT